MGPSTRPRGQNYDELRREGSLWTAWSAVREAGLASPSPQTQRAIKAFERLDVRNIRRIRDQLREGTFAFGKARGHAIPRPGKRPRPIVVSSIASRVVQRALLDELQRLPQIKKYLEHPTSFGGVPKRSREHAIAAALAALDSGAVYFVRSDIRDFFTRIPRAAALTVLTEGLDPAASRLLEQATALELDNARELGDDLNLFPTQEVGVAQGLCLSPLMGNVLLHKFDETMNGRGITCLRYIDDFLLLGTSPRNVLRAFDGALTLLGELGMDAYDPRSAPGKAEDGFTNRPFDFLGCSIQRGLVQPTARARAHALGRVREILTAAEKNLATPERARGSRASLEKVLFDVGNFLRGWRDSFNFCQAHHVFNDLDRAIDGEVDRFLLRFGKRLRASSNRDRRLLLGLPLLAGKPESWTARGASEPAAPT